MLSFLLSGNRETGFKREGNDDFAIQFDAIIDENHERDSQITSFPIEDGAEASDHIIINPERISITGFITNTPAIILGAGASSDNVQNAVDVLEDLWQSKELMTVVSDLKVYSDMAIESLSFPRDQRTGQALEFRVSLKKINKVSTELVLMPNDSNSDLASPEQDAGQQTPTTP